MANQSKLVELAHTLQKEQQAEYQVSLEGYGDSSYVNRNRTAFTTESPEETLQALKDLGYHVEGGK